MENPLIDALAEAGPALIGLRGPPGRGKTRRIREALDVSGTRCFLFGAPRLPDPDQRLLFRARLEAEAVDIPPDDSSWEVLLGTLGGWVEADRLPLVVVVDDAHRLLTGEGGFTRGLQTLWSSLRARALPVHLVLSGDSPEIEAALAALPEPLTDALALLEAPRFGVADLAGHLPRWSPADRLRAWAVFGGEPSRLGRVDPRATLEREVRRLVLAPEGPLHDGGETVLRGRVQNPERYTSLLQALAAGARDWKGLRERCPDFATGSQMAPYVGRLEELGLVDVRRSLDAGPRSRNRRYETADAFPAFWHRFVLPHRGELDLGKGAAERLWRNVVATGLDAHVARLFPRACREWMATAAGDLLPTGTRETGGLWGAGYDMDPAGTLYNGAPFYGVCVWHGDPVSEAVLDALEAQLRETRYGFGREARVRLVFSASGFTAGARRRIAREALVYGIGLAEMVGDAGSPG